MNPTADGRALRTDRSQRALKDAARRLFAAHGFEGTSVREIGRAAGVNPGLVRYHFGSKTGLFEQVIDEVMGALSSRLAAAFLSSGSLAERLQRTALAYFDYLVGEPDFPRLVVRAILDEQPQVLKLARRYLRPLVDYLPGGPLAPARSATYDVLHAALSVFGASIASFLYAPMLNEVLPFDVRSQEALAQRRRHLAVLVRHLGGA